MAHFADPPAVYSFGPFALDPASRRLTRNGEVVAIPDRHVDILLELLAHAGQIVSKDRLIEAAWKDVAVTDNSLEQAISVLRRALAQPPGETRYIETLARRGYRFSAPVSPTAPRHSAEALEAMLAPHRAFIEGRAALETLGPDAVERARGVFEDVVRTSPDYPSAHIGLANALVLRVEATRSAGMPDREALAAAIDHAREACRLEPSSGEAWSVLGLALHQSRDSAGAIAAAQRATMLEPDNWRHHLRFAFVTWGEQRLAAAHRALKLMPALALAHWLAATVYIARQAFAEAEHELVSGAAGQDRQPDGTKFRAVGLHLILGLLRLTRGDESSALEAFGRELSFDTPHIYARQAHANAWCAIGAVRLLHGERNEALGAFERAAAAVTGHPPAVAARAAVTADILDKNTLDARLRELRGHGAATEAAFAEATYETVAGNPARAAYVVHAALQQDVVASVGWTAAIDPFLRVSAYPEHWDVVLTLLRARAA